VPLDLNNADLYIGGPTGQGILSPAEQAFLVGNRTNRTVVQQSMISAFATGDLFDFADRTIAAAVGFEYRKDEIESQNDIVGVQGLNAAESPLQEGETVGDRDLFEVFGEISVPILDNLDFDAAVRFTDEENFGSETTWRARVAWVATDWLTLSGAHGTSFRAPNLREQFLADQFGGLSGSLDPCIAANIAALVADAGDQGPGVELVINNCIADGVTIIDTDGNGFPDDSLLGAGGVVTIPKVSGGNSQLLAETSETDTFTVKFSQPWSDAFDLDLAVSYWDISIEDTVAEPEPGFVIGGCYSDLNFPNLTSPFCDLITRSGGAAASNFISALNVSFVNIGEETARGIDINTRVNFTFEGLGVDLSWVTATTKLLEQEIETFEPADRDDNLGEIGTPEWKFTSTLSLVRGDWEFLMQNRYIGDAQDDNTDEFLVATGRRENWTSLEATRRVNWVEETWYTDVSVSYLQDVWSVTLGINNVADESPPIVDSLSGGPNRNSAVSSAGYDFFGRTWFVTAAVSF
jgi:iron complex outermembrane receptor protein